MGCDNDAIDEMEVTLREDFGMRGHREDLVKRLDHILGQLGRGLDYLAQHSPKVNAELIPLAKRDYRRLKGKLLEADRETVKTLTRAPPG